MDRVKFSPSTMTDDELVSLIKNHKTKMAGNANFQTLSPPPEEFDAKAQPYLDADAQVTGLEDELKIAIETRNSKRPAAEEVMLKRRDYVQTASGGSGSIILSSAFAIAAKPGGQAAPPVRPEGFAATMGNLRGSVDIMWHAQRRRSFIIQICEGALNDANWRQFGVTTNSRFTAKGLTSGAKYWFRVCAILGDAQSDWCAPVQCIAP
ncbi:MAG: fibronectin type III domain-containing protein [Verrucomicrobia bacterium]|nr:fibronectin type III domain-containing protein [Verrucomicrobiota bacterium]